MIHETDFLVIGSGIAGLNFALIAAEKGKVTVITKKKVNKTNTALAQGGVAAVLSKDDSFDLHINDTLSAGAGLCDREVVEMVVKSAPEMIKSLVDKGAKFNKKNGSDTEFAMGQEGGHSRKRIIHAHDLTGKEIEDVLVKHSKAHKNIEIFENHLAVNLITHSKRIKSGTLVTDYENQCCGAYVLNNETEEIETFHAGIILIAAGGAGKVYLYTTNPDIAAGDGVAMAYRAGASIANLEFVQFHPTCLFHPKAKNFLISEAVRGEGAILKDIRGNEFMEKYSPDRELACRDVVARAIDNEMKINGDEFVLLDISHKNSVSIMERFPNIYSNCLKFGIDITKKPIPVVPAAHYMCGGVATGTSGQTDVKRLYVAGEAACTGLHGANRLASNSLLEALVYSKEAAIAAIEEISSIDIKLETKPLPWDMMDTDDSDEAIVVTQNWDEIRRLMWNYVGIVRTDKRLSRALRRIENIKQEIHEYYWNFKITSDLVELRNLATVAELIIKSALIRKESRGLHYNLEYPERDDINWLKNTILKQKSYNF